LVGEREERRDDTPVMLELTERITVSWLAVRRDGDGWVEKKKEEEKRT